MKPQKIFLIIAAVFGTIWVFLVPPFQAPDEITHFCRVEELSNGQVGEVSVLGRKGGYLPQDLDSIISELGSNDTKGGGLRALQEPGMKQDPKSLLRVLGLPPSGTVFVEYNSRARTYPPVLYLPQTAGTAFAGLLNLPTIAAFYMSRLFNLAFFMLAVYSSIRITPCFKWGFLLLALVPFSLHVAASVGPDSFVNGVSFLWFALIFKYSMTANNEILGGKDVAALLILSMLLALSKAIYTPLILLVFLIPHRRFGSPARKTLLTSAALAGLIAAGLFWLWAIVFTDFKSTHSINISAMLHNPIGVILAVINIVFDFGFFSSEYMPGTLGRLDTKLPGYLTPLLLILVISAFAANYGGEDVEIGAKKKALISILIFASLVAMFYVFFVPDLRVVWGIQGRYFIPLGVGFFSLFHSRRLSSRLHGFIKPETRLNLYLGSIMSGALAVSTVRIVTRYYLP